SMFSVIAAHHPVLFHGFSGSWGDGTSGRVTLPADLYRKYGYINRIFPRQVDEIGLIANVLKNEPQIYFVYYRDADVREKSRLLAEFISLNGLRAVNSEVVERPATLSPVNPRGGQYVKDSHLLTFYQNFNAAYTYWLLSSEERAK